MCLCREMKCSHWTNIACGKCLCVRARVCVFSVGIHHQSNALRCVCVGDFMVLSVSRCFWSALFVYIMTTVTENAFYVLLNWPIFECARLLSVSRWFCSPSFASRRMPYASYALFHRHYAASGVQRTFPSPNDLHAPQTHTCQQYALRYFAAWQYGLVYNDNGFECNTSKFNITAILMRWTSAKSPFVRTHAHNA